MVASDAPTVDLFAHPMSRSLSLLAALVLAFSVTACGTIETTTDKLFAKNSGNDFQKSKTFEATPDKVFAAANAALSSLNFKADRVAAAQRILDASRRILPGDSIQQASQLTMRVKIEGDAVGAVVSVVIREVADSSFNEHAAMGTTKSLSQSSLYELYFATITTELAKAQ